MPTSPLHRFLRRAVAAGLASSLSVAPPAAAEPQAAPPSKPPVAAPSDAAPPTAVAAANLKPLDTSRGDRLIADYFRRETAALAGRPTTGWKTPEAWKAAKEAQRARLAEMLGLSPMPPRGELNAVVTGRIERDDFQVEKVHFQSLPGLYVIGNLYLPKPAGAKKAPAVLYVCGHSKVVKDGKSLGNKTDYHQHGVWFAKNGVVCLTIDTIQLGEIEGVHHGTYGVRKDGKSPFQQMWWWNARGYTPAGVEAWNGIRALDYLETRPEVDAKKFGVTGRSGGGAYSWWIAALDERIQAAVPVAGVTDLENHVVDGAVEGHCDCMFPINTYRWDFSQVGALVSPRPLLVSNSDKDPIFPLEGVVRFHSQVRDVYRLEKAADKLGLLIVEGGHKDVQELQTPAFRWMNRWLRGVDEPVAAASKVFAGDLAELQVFDQLPADAKNARIHETFTLPPPFPPDPTDAAAWSVQRDAWMHDLRSLAFRGWPDAPHDSAGGEAPRDVPGLSLGKAFAASKEGIDFAGWDFVSQEGLSLRLYVAHRSGLKSADLDLVVLNVLDEAGWNEWLRTIAVGFPTEMSEEGLHPAPVGGAAPQREAAALDAAGFESLKKMFAAQKWGMAWLAPRGIGPTAWNQSERKQTHHRRRFQLLGQTLDGMRTWDVRRGMQAVRAALPPAGPDAEPKLWLQAERNMAGVALYASLFEPAPARLDLWRTPQSHQPTFAAAGDSASGLAEAAYGPDYLNVLRKLDVPQAMALAAERSQIRLYEDAPADGPAAARGAAEEAWAYPQEVAKKLGWDAKRIQVRKRPPRK